MSILYNQLISNNAYLHDCSEQIHEERMKSFRFLHDIWDEWFQKQIVEFCERFFDSEAFKAWLDANIVKKRFLFHC